MGDETLLSRHSAAFIVRERVGSFQDTWQPHRRTVEQARLSLKPKFAADSLSQRMRTLRAGDAEWIFPVSNRHSAPTLI